jgi:hypothetical protein
MFKKKIISVLMLAVLAVSVCSAKPAKADGKAKAGKQVPMPAWVNVPSSVYPSGTYIAAVGSARDRASAEVKAVQAVAAVFKQKIDSTEKASNRMIQARKDGMVATAQLAEFDQQVLRYVNADDLIGIEIKEFWNDEKNSTWYAIAVMEKSKAASLYSDLIRANISSINRMIGGINENTIDSYAYCDFAVEVAEKNEDYYARLSVINPAMAEAVKADMVSPKKLRVRAMEIANAIPVCVVIENDVDGRFAQAFAGVLKGIGFKTTFNPGVRYMISGKVSFEESITTDNTNVRCRYSLDSYMTDTVTGRNVIPFTISGRESHTSYSEAKVRAVREIEKKITAEFGETLRNYTKQFSD